MEKSEPTLVPEWLKGTGNVTGGGSSIHHSALSSLHSDDHASTVPTRNRSSLNISDNDSPRSSSFLDRTSSSYFRRSSSSNGSTIHDKESSRSYSSFSRSHRERDWEKGLDFREKERSVMGDHRLHNYSDPLANILPSRLEKDILRRSQSMVSGKRGEAWPRKVASDSNNGNNNNHNNVSGPLRGGSIARSINKAAFERDFPSLGAEERQGAIDIGRVPSPGLSTTTQTLPIGNAVIGGDGWTSALAEVPVIIGSNSMGLSSSQQNPPAGSLPTPPSATGLNMAETLAQGPSRVRAAPHISVETQRLEELAIKQSRQLIPMTPSMPKTSVLNPSEKSKPKTPVRIGDTGTGTKTGLQQLSALNLVNHSHHAGPVRPDVPKTSQAGKLLVLKVPREKNGVSQSPKDDSNGASRVANNPISMGPSAASAPPMKNPNSPKPATALPAIPVSSMERRPTTSQVQSRNDFFNLMRKKSSINLSSVPGPNSALEKPEDSSVEINSNRNSPQATDAPSDPHFSNSEACKESLRFSDNGVMHPSPDAMVYPDEEEAAFLRLLGWEENAAGEEEGLTEEEINAFYQEYKKLKPLSKLCQGMQQVKHHLPIESHVGSLVDASSGVSSSDSESEA